MKCWNCGSENSSSKKYCNSCASLLADPRKKEQLDVSAGQLILAIMRMIGRELARSAMAYIGLIGVVAAIVLISDLITGSRLMAELGRILVIIGGFMMLISVLSIHRIPEKLVLARHSVRKERLPHAVLYHTAFAPMWRSIWREPSANQYSQSLMFFLVALTVIVVGCLLL